MPILIDKTGPIHNEWKFLEDDEPVPKSGHFIISVDRWFDSSGDLDHYEGSLGILLDPETDVARLRPDLDTLKLVAIHFGVFSDGRGFSQARLLRERYGYNSNIRAVGDVLRDQLSFMARCGINQFDVENEVDIEAALKAFSTFSVGYQLDMAKHVSYA